MYPDLTIKEICWICGAPATTGEHIVKKTLLKYTFGDADKVFLYFEDGKRKPKTMKSPDSKYIKYRKNLCQNCNGSLTQPFDKAYDMFINILRDNKKEIVENKYIDLSKFKKFDRQNLFRYFAKEFGCKINNERLAVPQCIKDMMHGKQYGKNLMLLFYFNDDNKKLKIGDQITQSDILRSEKDDVIVDQYDVSLGWLMYIVCYTNLPSKIIRKINNKSKIKPWCGKREKILIRKFP